MPLNVGQIQSIQNTSVNPEDVSKNIVQNVTSAVKDPFGAIITKTMSKVNGLTTAVESKIDQLAKDIVKSVDSTGKVTLEGSSIVITISPEDVAQAQEIQSRINGKIVNIQKMLTTLTSILNTLKTVQQAITTLQAALTIQETVLSLNPATGPMFTVFKKAIKIVFLKDMIGEYSKILANQLKANLSVLDRLSTRFKDLRVTVKISDESNKGNFIDATTASNLIIQELLDQGSKDIKNVTTDYTSAENDKYLLKVEKYGDKQLIGRAYDKVSGFIKEQTSPSFFSTPEELIEELKSILNLQP